MSNLAEADRVGTELMKYVQERCQPCISAKLGAVLLAEKVIKEGLDKEVAAENYATEIASDCYGGDARDDEPGMPFKCWRGIRIPVTPMHLRKDT